MPVDLDISCVLLDEQGRFTDVVYFANPKSADGSVCHQGDSKDGEEVLIANLKKVREEVAALVVGVHSYSAVPLASLSSVKVSVSGKGKEGRSIVLGGGSKQACSALVLKIVRVKAHWKAHALGKAVEGKSFSDLLLPMQDSVKEDLPAFLPAPRLPSILLTKGETVALSDKVCGKAPSKVFFGVGWDMLGTVPVDLDASAVLFSKGQVVEAVNFNSTSTANRSVWHAGDNLTGAGDGDDERIHVDLNLLDAKVDNIFLVVNSFSGHTFDHIKNAFVRLVDADTNKELLRLNLSGVGSKAHSSFVLCRLFHAGAAKEWRIKSLGFGTQGRKWNDNLKDFSQELQGKLDLKRQEHGLKFVPPHSAPITKALGNPGGIFNFLIVLLAVMFVLVLLDRNNKNITRR